MKMQADAQENDKQRQFDQMIKQMDIEMEKLNLSADEKQAFDNHKIKMAELSLKLKTQMQLSREALMHDRDSKVADHMMLAHTSKQAMAPPTEPVGTAPDGMAFIR